MSIPRPARPILKRFSRSALVFAILVLAGVGIVAAHQATAGTAPVPCEILHTDKAGRPIDTSAPFQRIISLYGAHTENLSYLGADAQLIGVSVNDNYPDAILDKPRFSYHDGPEKFLAARPDLILIRPMIDNGYPQLIRQLESFGIRVISLQPANIREMYAYWLTLGKLAGKEKNALNLINGFRDKIDRIQKKASRITARKTVYFQAIHSRMKTFTPGSMPIFALETAGGINAAGDATASRNTNVAVYGKEQILEKAGTIDVIIAQKGIMNPVTREMILREPGFHIIKAVKSHQVFLIDEQIVSRPVPRLCQGILTIGKLLYPTVFNQKEDL